MNFPRLPRTLMPVEAMDHMTRELRETTNRVNGSMSASPPEEYIPAAHRNTQELGGLTVAAVKNFSELPTKAIDDLIASVKDRLGAIERKGDQIRSDYVLRTTELTAEIERLNAACVQSETKMNELHDQLTEIYRPSLQPKAAKTEERNE